MNAFFTIKLKQCHFLCIQKKLLRSELLEITFALCVFPSLRRNRDAGDGNCNKTQSNFSSTMLFATSYSFMNVFPFKKLLLKLLSETETCSART